MCSTTTSVQQARYSQAAAVALHEALRVPCLLAQLPVLSCYQDQETGAAHTPINRTTRVQAVAF
jgi:hypothetical protein